MYWIPLVLISVVGYGLYNFFNKLAVDYISVATGVAVFHLTSGMLALGFAVALPYFGYEKVFITKTGFIYSSLAGISLFFGAAGLFWIYKSGMALSVGLTTVLIGTVIFTTILAFIFLKESITLNQAIGLVLGTLSIYFFSR